MGYGAMQLAGPGVFGPPKDRDGAIKVLREAVAGGVNHIDTSDYYGPYVTNELIREAFAPIRKTRHRDQNWREARGRRLVEPGNGAGGA